MSAGFATALVLSTALIAYDHVESGAFGGVSYNESVQVITQHPYSDASNQKLSSFDSKPISKISSALKGARESIKVGATQGRDMETAPVMAQKGAGKMCEIGTSTLRMLSLRQAEILNEECSTLNVIVSKGFDVSAVVAKHLPPITRIVVTEEFDGVIPDYVQLDSVAEIKYLYPGSDVMRSVNSRAKAVSSIIVFVSRKDGEPSPTEIHIPRSVSALDLRLERDVEIVADEGFTINYLNVVGDGGVYARMFKTVPPTNNMFLTSMKVDWSEIPEDTKGQIKRLSIANAEVGGWDDITEYNLTHLSLRKVERILLPKDFDQLVSVSELAVSHQAHDIFSRAAFNSHSSIQEISVVESVVDRVPRWFFNSPNLRSLTLVNSVDEDDFGAYNPRSYKFQVFVSPSIQLPNNRHGDALCRTLSLPTVESSGILCSKSNQEK